MAVSGNPQEKVIKKDKKTLAERAFERMDVRAELVQLEDEIAKLKVEYEQYFLGLNPFTPDKLHNDVRKHIRLLRKAPFKSSQMMYQLRVLETRYNTFNSYWQRILREKEAGTYIKDIFKANLREQIAKDEAESQSAKGQVSKTMKALFDSYAGALEKATGKKQSLDFDAFQKSLVNRAKDFREKNGNKKLTFKVVMKDGKVTVQAKVKE
jgi:hypothetical protein